MNPNIELWNNIALIEDDAYFTRWVKETGKLDHHDGFLNAIEQYIKGTVLDIGANIGTHTCFYVKYANRVLAFEPNPIAFECLQHNVQQAELFNVAVSDHIGYINLSPQGTNYGAVYTVPVVGEIDEQVHEAGSMNIPTITIDSLNLNACHFIKIDVEGDEIAVLTGAKETILKYKPVMCIECNIHTLTRKGLTGDQLVAVITALGYSTSIRQPEDISCDLICLPL